MSKQFIYASDIVLPKSVIGLLDGSEQFCFENPYFSVPGITKPDKKSYIEVKSVSSKFGVMLNSIYIFYKGANNVFTKQYAIGYTETSKIGSTVVKKPKEYYVVKPFDTNDLGRTNRYKLIIMPSKNEICPEDDILAKLDYQFSMVMDVLCIAKILDINLSKYAKMNNISLSDLIRNAVLEKIEDEYDLECYKKAMEEYKKNPKTYTMDEV